MYLVTAQLVLNQVTNLAHVTKFFRKILKAKRFFYLKSTLYKKWN